VELKKARHFQPCLLGLCGGAPEKEAHARVTGDDNPQMMFRITTLLESGCAVAHDVGELDNSMSDFRSETHLRTFRKGLGGGAR